MAAAALLALLAGCTGSGETPAPDDSPSAGATSSAQELETGEVQQPPELEDGWQGILGDVTVENCPTEAGDVTATGTVLNSAKKPRDISIVVAWNAPDSTRSIMQLAVTKKDVPAGKTVTWKVSGDLPSASGPCIVLARSGELA